VGEREREIECVHKLREAGSEEGIHITVGRSTFLKKSTYISPDEYKIYKYLEIG
jgi:hypothetical protein